LAEQEEIGSITIKNQSIAASGGQKRRWRDKKTGQEHHHLIDPHTGESSNRHAGVFTLADNALIADAASTILYLVPDDQIPRLASEMKVEYLIVNPDGHALHSPGYPAQLHT